MSGGQAHRLRLPFARRYRAPARPSGNVWPVILGLGLAAATGVIAGTGDLSMAVVCVAAPAFLLIATAAPEKTTLALIALLPYMVYPATSGRFSLFLAVPLFGYVSLIITLRERAILHQLRGSLPVLAFAVLLAIAVITAAVSVDPSNAMTRVAYIVLFGWFAAALAVLVINGRLSKASIAKAIVWAGALAGAGIVIQFVAQFGAGKQGVIDWLQSVYATFGGQRASKINLQTSNWELSSPDVLRGVFPFMTPPSAGQFLMLSLIAALWLRREARRRSPASSTVLLAVTLLIGIALLLTFSRQAWIGAAVGVIALGLRRRPERMFALIGAAALLLAVVPIPGSGQSFGSYLLTASDTSTTSTGTRLDLWQQAIDLIPGHALVGTGPGLIASAAESAGGVFYAHNVFIDAAVELGIAGGLALIALFYFGLAAAWRNRSALAFALLSAFVVASLFDDVLLFPRNGLLLAAAFALIAREPEESRSPTAPD